MQNGKSGTGRLTLAKETVRSLSVRTAVRTGGSLNIETAVTLQTVCFDPITAIKGEQGGSHAGICLPPSIFGGGSPGPIKP